MALIRYSQTSRKGPTPDRRSYDEVLGLLDENGELIRSSSSPRGSTYWKRLRRCPHEHALYQGGLRKDSPLNDHLTIGLMVHRAMEHFYGAQIPDHGVDPRQLARGHSYRTLDTGEYQTRLAPETAAWRSIEMFSDEPGYETTFHTVQRMLTGYFELYRELDFRWKVHAVEETVSYREPLMEWTGRYDGLIERDGMLWLLEHKTATSITPDLLSGYQLDMQMLGYVWLYQKVIDTTKFPPLGGLIVNILTKPKTMNSACKYERVEVCPNRDHLAAFEDSMRRWITLRGAYEAVDWPRALGNCAGAVRYFSNCDYFDLCHSRPDVPVAKLLREEPPTGFVLVDMDALGIDPDEIS